MLDFADAPRQETICNAQVRSLASCCTSVTHGHTWMQNHFDTKKIIVLMEAVFCFKDALKGVKCSAVSLVCSSGCGL